VSNNGGVYTFSKTPANNATADNTVNWAEGQAPSSINDSARNMMASIAKYRDDISGSIVTGRNVGGIHRHVESELRHAGEFPQSNDRLHAACHQRRWTGHDDG
jgi:hypothetical protein